MNARRSLFALLGLMTVSLGLVPDDVLAQERRHRRAPRNTAVQLQPPPSPMLAVVGLREQRIAVYDSTGARMLESSVSSGATGYETPPGIFSVVQKEVEHHSNLYDDASMPFMQRLTWTGIALHAGVVPGYPASHGCVRLPYNVAENLFGQTKIGMRVIVARESIAPVAIAEPAMFRQDGATARTGEAGGRRVQVASVEPDAGATGPEPLLSRLERRVTALTQAAEDAARRAKELRTAAARAKSAVPAAERTLKRAEGVLARAEAELKAAEKVIEKGGSKSRIDRAEKAKAEAPARIDAARKQFEKAEAEAKAKRDAASEAEEASASAATAHARALEAVEQAKNDMSPVSVFVSRTTQRIYVRKAFHPLWEAPVLIRDADKPIGTFVFTANEPAEGTQDLRWSVLSLYKDPTDIEPADAKAKSSKRVAAVDMPVTDATAAQAALDRLSVPPEMERHISKIVLPGSSLIISDEPPHLETGKDTDFVVIMSGEPQGGIAIRKRSKPARSYSDDQYWYSGGSSSKRRSGGGGGFFWFNY